MNFFLGSLSGTHNKIYRSYLQAFYIHSFWYLCSKSSFGNFDFECFHQEILLDSVFSIIWNLCGISYCVSVVHSEASQGIAFENLQGISSANPPADHFGSPPGVLCISFPGLFRNFPGDSCGNLSKVHLRNPSKFPCRKPLLIGFLLMFRLGILSLFWKSFSSSWRNSWRKIYVCQATEKHTSQSDHFLYF